MKHFWLCTKIPIGVRTCFVSRGNPRHWSAGRAPVWGSLGPQSSRYQQPSPQPPPQWQAQGSTGVSGAQAQSGSPPPPPPEAQQGSPGVSSGAPAAAASSAAAPGSGSGGASGWGSGGTSGWGTGGGWGSGWQQSGWQGRDDDSEADGHWPQY